LPRQALYSKSQWHRDVGSLFKPQRFSNCKRFPVLQLKSLRNGTPIRIQLAHTINHHTILKANCEGQMEQTSGVGIGFGDNVAILNRLPDATLPGNDLYSGEQSSRAALSLPTVFSNHHIMMIRELLMYGCVFFSSPLFLPTYHTSKSQLR